MAFKGDAKATEPLEEKMPSFLLWLVWFESDYDETRLDYSVNDKIVETKSWPEIFQPYVTPSAIEKHDTKII